MPFQEIAIRRLRSALCRWMRPACVCALILAAAPFTTRAAGEKVRVLADFNAGGGIFKDAKAVQAVKELGGKAAKVGPGSALKSDAPGRGWNAYTHLLLDVFNPNAAPVRLHLCLKDDSAPHGYYSWINRYLTVGPGKHTLELQISALRRGEGSPKDHLDSRPFHWDRMSFAMITGLKKGVGLFVGKVRLVKRKVRTFAGVRAFDFGPVRGGVTFLGFHEVTPATRYTKARGFGWVGKAPAYARHRSKPPDELVGDWCSDYNVTFRVDLPNGEYEGWALMDDPGEWEFYQNFTRRSLTVNGVSVVNEKMSGKDFLDRYFHFAETEDHPGDKIWERYIAWRYPQRRFSFRVTEGKAEAVIRGSGQYAATLNALALWPKEKSKDGKAFLADVDRRRRKQLARRWTEKRPKKEPLDPALAAKFEARGYVPFQRPPGRDVGYYAAPKDEAGTRIELKAVAAWGQSEPLPFAIHALRDLKGVVVKASPFKSAAGDVLPAAAVRCAFVNYKIKRIGFGSAGLYGVVPFIVKPFKPDGPDRAASAKKGSARRFWTTVTVPEGQKAGIYKGTLTLSAQGAPDLKLPATVEVLPFKLPDADMGLGLFGTTPAPYSAYGFPENQARVEADRKRLLADLRAHGMTSFFAGGIRFRGFKNGRAVWDIAEAEKQAQAARQAGFSVIHYRVRNHPVMLAVARTPEAAAKKFGFAGGGAILKAVFGSLTERCAKRGLPEPLFSFGDEPGTKPEVEKLLGMYANVRKAGGRGYISYSTMHELTKPFLDVLSVSSLNVTTLADIRRARKAGNHVWLNNQGRSRWAYGVYMWKAHEAGVEVHQQFIYNGPHTDPYYALDGIEDEESMVYPGRRGTLRPRVDWERIRQGTNDYRTLLLFKRLSAKAGAKGRAAWAPVKKILDGLRFEKTGRDKRPQLSEAQLDQLRALAVQGIHSLMR